jgi:hypothetical protein
MSEALQTRPKRRYSAAGRGLTPVEDQRPSETTERQGGDDRADDVPGDPRVLEVVADGGQIGDSVWVARIGELVVERTLPPIVTTRETT